MIINGLYVPKSDGFWTQDEMIFIQWLKPTTQDIWTFYQKKSNFIESHTSIYEDVQRALEKYRAKLLNQHDTAGIETIPALKHKRRI